MTSFCADLPPALAVRGFFCFNGTTDQHDEGIKMTYPGEVRYVDTTGDGDWTVYVRDRTGIWYPADIGGPGYLTDNQIAKKVWTSDGR